MRRDAVAQFFHHAVGGGIGEKILNRIEPPLVLRCSNSSPKLSHELSYVEGIFINGPDQNRHRARLEHGPFDPQHVRVRDDGSLLGEIGNLIQVTVREQAHRSHSHGGSVPKGALAAEQSASGLVPSRAFAQPSKHFRRRGTVAAPRLGEVVAGQNFGHVGAIESAAFNQRIRDANSHVRVVGIPESDVRVENIFNRRPRDCLHTLKRRPESVAYDYADESTTKLGFETRLIHTRPSIHGAAPTGDIRSAAARFPPKLRLSLDRFRAPTKLEYSFPKSSVEEHRSWGGLRMADQRPNIILIITDQQRYDTINALGFPYADTPSLDRLVEEGVAFTHCFVNAPSCGPSRASLFTGYSPHNHGAQRNNDPWPRTWVESLRDAGYRCVNIGKMHADPYEALHGFHERQVVENKQRRTTEVQWRGTAHAYNDEFDKALQSRGFKRLEKDYFRQLPEWGERLGAYEWHLPDELHPDFFVGDMALRWLEQAPPMEDEPLFLQIGFPGPHPPYDPVARYAEPYMAKDLPILPVTAEEMDAQPGPIKALRQKHIERNADSVGFRPDAPMEHRHRQRAYYMANMTMIDEKIEQILALLDRRGQLENSVVIFTSDHGDCLGDHGLSQKWNMYDASVRVPLIVWAPKRFKGGRKAEGLQQLFDVGPTILELAGIDVPPGWEAESLVPVLTGNADAAGREYVFSEHARDVVLDGTEMQLMIRSKDWKLVEFFEPAGGHLFDLRNDPDEIVDLWDDPAHGAIKQELRDALHSWFVTSSAKGAGWRNQPRTA